MFHRKPVSQDPVVVLVFPGKIQWVWEKPCLYTPPEGIDCVFIEHAYLTRQVPDRLRRFFFFFFGKETYQSFQGTLFQTEATTGQCRYIHSLQERRMKDYLWYCSFAPLYKVQVCHSLCWSFKATLSGTAKWMSTSLKRTLCGLSAFNSRIRTEVTVSL